MILDTFTKEELIYTLTKVVSIFEQRAANFMSYNAQDIVKRARKGQYYKTFSGVVDRQRFYYNVVYTLENDYIKMGRGPLFTVVPNGRRNLIVEFHSFEDPKSRDGSYLRIYTEHFLTRFCERMGLPVESMSVVEKANAFGGNNPLNYSATQLGDFLTKYTRSRLNANFLDKEDFNIWFASSPKGDVAVIEAYGSIPVWRTFISEEMLRQSQTDDPCYQLIKEMSEKQVDDPEKYATEKLHK